jgi:predicted metal-dependent peptidase
MTASKMDRAKTQLICKHPFFSTILLQGGITPRTDIPTACVNTRGQIFYNPTFVESLTVNELIGLLAHETLHKVGLHLLRRGTRDPQRWNVATDWWINETLLKEGFTLPEGALRHEGAETQTSEDLYRCVPEDDPTGGGSGGATGNDLLDEGDPLTPEEASRVEAETKVLVACAAQAAKLAGKLSATLRDLAAGLVQSTVPWYDVLEVYMQTRVLHDSSWARPNRRYAPDWYLPSTAKQPSMGPVLLVVDVSGSISEEELAHYNGHLQRILTDARPTSIHVCYTDTEVKRHDTYEHGDEVALTHYSGGGTNMEAALAYAAREALDPDVCVILTDGHTAFTQTDSPYPVVWLITTPGITAPYGTTIHPNN